MNRTAIWPSNPTAGHTHWGNQNWKGHVYPNVHHITVYIARTWKQPRCPSADEWIRKLWYIYTAAAAKSLQLCPTLCDPIDGSPPGSAVPGCLQARTLEWVAISFANAWKWKVKVKSLSRVWLLATSWTAAYQAPPSMGFSRQEYWSGVPLLSVFYVLHQSRCFSKFC